MKNKIKIFFSDSLRNPRSRAVLLVALLLFFGPWHFARAESESGAIIKVFAQLLELANDFLRWTISPGLYENVFFSDVAKEAVLGAWKVVQGFVNMFYLLILIFLALATILQINGFNDKKLFVKVILSAILVNFSLPITVFVIDLSNIFMNYFASAIHSTSVANVFFDSTQYEQLTKNLGFFSSIGMDIFSAIIYSIVIVMLLWTAAALLIRLVAYWVLIILSPLAFFSLALPGSSGFKEWKDKLVHYSFFGPIMLFFIWLSLYLLNSLKAAFLKHPEPTSYSKLVVFIVGYITGIYLLYYGHDKSRTMASKAGDLAGNFMGKAWAHGAKTGKFMATAGPLGMMAKSYGKAGYEGGRAFLKKHKATSWLTKEGREEKQKERDEMAKSLATGKGSLKERYQRTKDRQEMKKISDKEKEMLEAGYDLDNIDELKRLRDGGGLEGKVAAKRLAEKGKLGGEGELEKAINVAGDNELLRKHILTKTSDKNKVAYMNYNLKHYSDNEDSKKFVNDMYKKAIEEYNKNNPDAEVVYDPDSERDIDRFLVAMSQEKGLKPSEVRKQMAYNGMFAGAKSVNQIADILNEDAGKQGEEAARAFANYAQDPNFGAERYNRENWKAKEILNNNLNSKASAELRNRGFF